MIPFLYRRSQKQIVLVSKPTCFGQIPSSQQGFKLAPAALRWLALVLHGAIQ